MDMDMDMELGEGSSASSSSSAKDSLGSFGGLQNIRPINPLHHGKVNYLTTMGSDGKIEYRRTFLAPCAYGMLVFNIGPALDNLPYAYDIYEDAYAYSDNRGLCFFYPSWKGVQTSEKRMWMPGDPTELRVPLGDHENKISTRVVIPNDDNHNHNHNHAKNFTKRGGDFLIIRKRNFYNAQYYKALKAYVNNLPADADIDEMMLDGFEYDIDVDIDIVDVEES